MKAHLLFTVLCLATLLSCRYATRVDPKKTDLVCGKPVLPMTSFSKSYKGSTYYFDTYACKMVFTHKPDRFIHNPTSGKGKKFERAKF